MRLKVTGCCASGAVREELFDNLEKTLPGRAVFIQRGQHGFALELETNDCFAIKEQSDAFIKALDSGVRRLEVVNITFA